MVIPPTVRWIDMQNYGQASMIMQAGAPRTDASPSVRCRCDGNRCSDPPVRAPLCATRESVPPPALQPARENFARLAQWTTVTGWSMGAQRMGSFEGPKLCPDGLRVDEQEVHLGQLLGEVEVVLAVNRCA